MKKFAWFKHPNDLSNDKRLSALIDHEGGRGYATLFNALTGANERTGNFPGVTVTRST